MAFIVHNTQRDYHLSSTYTVKGIKEGRWGFHFCEHQWRVKRLMYLIVYALSTFKECILVE